MGDGQVSLFRPTFNRSVQVIASTAALTEDAGALLLREASRRLGLDRLLHLRCSLLMGTRKRGRLVKDRNSTPVGFYLASVDGGPVGWAGSFESAGF